MELILFLLLLLLVFVVEFVVILSIERKIRAMPKNKVHFYVTCEETEQGDIIRTLWLGKPYCTKEKNVIPHFYGTAIAYNQALSLYNLNYSDFEDMKNGEIREVFLNLDIYYT